MSQWKVVVHNALSDIKFGGFQTKRRRLLTETENILLLDGVPKGNYSIRIESGNEVLVKQIIIP